MNRAVCGKTQTARFCMGMDRGKSEQHAEEVRKSDQLNRAEGSRGDSPLQGQGAAPLVGFGATPQPLLVKTTQREQPTRRRQRSVPASNFALPQERPPSCSIPQRNIVAPDGRDRTAGLSDIAALSRKQGISPLRRRPKGMKTDECLRSPFGNLRAAHSHVS